MMRSVTGVGQGKGLGTKGSALLSVLVILVCLPFAWRTLAALDMTRLTESFATLHPWQWAAALAATACSFMALGRYDAIWHRILQSGVAARRASHVGTAAIAVSQSLGLTAVTAGLVRWRCLPELPVARVAAISGAVGLSFLLGWGICAIAAALLLGLLPVPPILGLWICAAALVLLWALGRMPLAVRAAAGVLLGWVVLDLAFAGTALWLLLPPDVALPWLPLVAAYVLALGAGLIGNSPGGVGPFELTLLALLPMLPAEEVLASLLAFRIVYYLIPFVLGAIYLIHAPRQATLPRPDGPADWALATQSGAIERVGQGWAHVVRPFGLRVTLGDTTGPAPTLHLPGYKVGPRTASRSRRIGWQTARIADEAIICLRDWSLDGPEKKRLRQALRRAEKRGVTVDRATGDLPTSTLRQIADVWSTDHGGELGLTVGRFCTRTLAQQRVYLIRVDGILRGFVTFNRSREDWSLDLIRYAGALPDGAVHCALTRALDDAGNTGARHVSLGAVPSMNGPMSRFAGQKAGLRHFKSIYAPSWQPRYYIAPDPARFAIAGLALVWCIQRPGMRLLSRVHHLLASFGVAPRARTRHIRTTPKDTSSHGTDRQRVDAPSQIPRLAAG